MSKLLKLGSHSRVRSRGWLWLVVFFAFVSCTFSATFTTSLDRQSIVVGEQVILTLKFDDGQPQEFSGFPQIDGLRYASPVNQSSSMVIENGVQSTAFSYTVAIEPTRVGEFTIPAFRAKVNGQILSSEPITLKVAANDSSAPASQLANRAAFLSVVLPKTNLFVNEPAIAEFRIYIRSGIHNYGNLQLQPEGSDLTFGKLVEGQHYQQNVAGTVFTVIPLSLPITPVKTGTLSLNPIAGSILLNARGGMDFGFFEPAGQPQQVPLTSDRIDLNVSPLPAENVPPGFNGAVGTYTMTVTACPTNVVAGDPVTLHIQISGRGALDSLVLPEQAGWENFKAYPPTAKLNLTDQLGIQGSKTFEKIVTPQNSDIKALPPISFSFFDPEQKKYRTLTQPPIPLVVRAANPGVMPAVANTHSNQDNSPAAPDVLPIKQHLGALAQIQPPLIQQPLFLGLQGVPVVAFVFAFIWRRRKESLANNPRLRRQRQVALLVRDGLVELRNFASQNKSDEFFATLFRLLQEQLGERLDVPASSITEAVIEERLRPRNVPEATLASLHEMFHMCNLARYAPIKSSQELAAIIPKLETLLNELRELTI